MHLPKYILSRLRNTEIPPVLEVRSKSLYKTKTELGKKNLSLQVYVSNLNSETTRKQFVFSLLSMHSLQLDFEILIIFQSCKINGLQVTNKRLVVVLSL